MGDEFLRQLVAEQVVRKVVRGVERLEWQKVYNRNEALDCFVLARAAAHLVGLDRFTDADWRTLEAPFGIEPSARSPPPPTSVTGTPPSADAPPPGMPQPTLRASVVPVPGSARPSITWRRSRYWESRGRGSFWR